MSATRQPRLWARMTWPEIEALNRSGLDAVLLPVGATEQHGPQLGCGMDSCLAESVCLRVSGLTGVPVLPTLAFGSSGAHSTRWPGTLSLRPQTLIEVVSDIGDWLFRTGFRRLFIFNCHVGNRWPLRCALDALRCRHDGLSIALHAPVDLGDKIRAEFHADAEDWHANAAETALMMALDPAMVREEERGAADDPDRTADCVFSHPVDRTSRNGVTGFPSRATLGQGEDLLEQVVAAYDAVVRAGLAESPPLAPTAAAAPPDNPES